MNKISESCSFILKDKSYLNLTKDECKEKIKEKIIPLFDRWYNSKCTDFSVYKDKDYIYELINCYYKLSRRCILDSINWLKRNEFNAQDLKILDDYNGIGLTTIDLIKKGFNNVNYFNDNKRQIKVFKRLCKKEKIKMPYNDKNHKNKYDIIIALELVEHYEKPFEYINKVIDLLNPGGYFIYSPSFKYNAIGHFRFYYNKKNIRHWCKYFGRYFNKELKKDFDRLYSGFYNKPIILKLKEI